jgi:hypothetical protein
VSPQYCSHCLSYRIRKPWHDSASQSEEVTMGRVGLSFRIWLHDFGSFTYLLWIQSPLFFKFLQSKSFHVYLFSWYSINCIDCSDLQCQHYYSIARRTSLYNWKDPFEIQLKMYHIWVSTVTLGALCAIIFLQSCASQVRLILERCKHSSMACMYWLCWLLSFCSLFLMAFLELIYVLFFICMK